jgi:hypothetical protein
MTSSALCGVRWFPGGMRVFINRDDGPHVVEIPANSAVTQQRISFDGNVKVSSFIKSDDELAYQVVDLGSGTSTFLRVVRSGDAWTKQPIIEGVEVFQMYARVSNDRRAWEYQTAEEGVGATLWRLEPAPGSKPVKLAGPADGISFAASPDGARFLLAVTAGGSTEVFGGPSTSLPSPPSVKKDLTLDAPYMTGYWAPDSSRAVTFQEGATFGRQFVFYNPGAAQKWEELPLWQMGYEWDDGASLWSPDSSVLAAVTRTSASSKRTITLVASANSKLDVDTAALIWAGEFSSGGEYFAYGKSDDGLTTAGAYVDLREGLAMSGPPIPCGSGDLRFATTTLEAVYTDGSTCSYLDLSGDAAVAPVIVNRGGSPTWCAFQELPRR